MSITRNSGDRSRIALLIQYDGTDFNGWQIQDRGRTVQGEIEKALKVLLKKDIRVIAAGRTDTGVHALGQVIHFDFSSDISLQKLCISLNGILDNDVKIKNAYLVPSDFHARFSALGREYLYIIYNHPLKSPFDTKRAVWISYDLDIDYLKRAAEHFIGEKDFASFCKKTSAEENTVRRIEEFDIIKFREFIIFRIRGNAFLHNMVRIIIGTILDLHKENVDPAYIKTILDQKNRDAGGKTAPPYGLYLNQIFYEPSLSEMESAF
ncbi:MAG: tRNA pseudouridine(38-40) synthase TruA [Spirochaetota bacterium]